MMANALARKLGDEPQRPFNYRCTCADQLPITATSVKFYGGASALRGRKRDGCPDFKQCLPLKGVRS
jgi:hypothetical protein